MYYRGMNEQAITAKALEPGDIITQGTLPNGTVATVEVHNWTVTVTYTDGREHFTSVLAILHVERVSDRLEELRAAIRAENVSWGELAELQNLAPFIDSDDIELLEWAGVPEEEES